MRERVTFSIESSLLKRLDQLVDGIRVRNRSHALEIVLERLLGADVFIFIGDKKQVPTAEKTVKWIKEQGFSVVVVSPPGTTKGEFIADPGQGTAAAMLALQGRVKNTFVIAYADAPKLEIQDMLRFHHNQGGIATLAVTSAKEPKKFGVVKLKGVKVREFVEKPETAQSYLASAGIFIFEPEVFQYIPQKSKSLEKDVLDMLSKNGLLNGYVFEGLMGE
jgi:NDP-sugar pyrophosphorylase family protein